MEKRFGFRCYNDECNISVFTLRPDQLTIKYVRDHGKDSMSMEGQCPVCGTTIHQIFEDKYCKERFDAMLEDIFRDIDPNLPEGV